MTAETDENIVPALMREGRQNVIRSLDRQAVSGAIRVENELRAEKLGDLMDAGAVVVEHNLGPHSSHTVSQRMKTALKRVEEAYAEAAGRLKEDLGAKNQEEVNQARAKQLQQHQALASMTSAQPEGEEVSEAVKTQEKAEMENLMHRLEVEQELELQRLHTHFASKKETALRALQSELADELARHGAIDAIQADKMSSELAGVGGDLSGWYDKERAKQRALLEHKYNLRKTLAMQKDLNDRQRNDLLNTMLEQQFEAVDLLRKKGLVSEEDGEWMKRELEEKGNGLKQWFHRERRDRERKLLNTTARENKKKIAELKKKHEKELTELTSKSPPDSQNALENLKERQELLSEQRQELLRLEENLDQEAAGSLGTLHHQLAEESKNHLDVQRSRMFQEKGVSAESVADILREEEEELKSIAAHQERVKNEQEDQLDQDLKLKQAELNRQMDHEIKTQNALREHEHQILKNLLEHQVALSEEEREELQRYKDEHMAQMENSLATGKLAQLTLLEHKLQKRRASAMEGLERRLLASNHLHDLHHNEKQELGHEWSLPKKSSFTDDLKLIHDIARQKVDILKETTSGKMEDIRQVESELMERRVGELREQENQLGSVVSKLQLRKARQMADLEETSEALQGVTSCMVEDLTERGILSNPDCHKIIERHEQEQKKLSESLSAQKLKQEFQLIQQLEERSLRKQSVLSQEHAHQISRLQHTPYSSQLARTIANAHLLDEHAKENASHPEDVAKSLEQCLAEEKRKFEIKKKEALQEQELKFIGSLVEMGDFEEDELTQVLKLVVPQKSKSEVTDILKTLGKSGVKKRSTGSVENKDPNRLAKKVDESRIEALEFESKNLRKMPKKRTRSRRRSLRSDTISMSSNSLSSRTRTTLPPISKRPEPLGASVDEITEYLPPRRLAKLTEVNSTFHY